jgi:hypothetical protein
LRPGPRFLAVEDQCRVGVPALYEAPLELPVAQFLALGRVGVHVEPDTPAAAPHAVVPLRQVGERLPGIGAQCPDPKAVDGDHWFGHADDRTGDRGRETSWFQEIVQL